MDCIRAVCSRVQPVVTTTRTVREMMETVQLSVSLWKKCSMQNCLCASMCWRVLRQKKNICGKNDESRSWVFTTWSLRSTQGAGSNKHLLRKSKHWNGKIFSQDKFTRAANKKQTLPILMRWFRSVASEKENCSKLSASENLLRLEFRHGMQIGFQSFCTSGKLNGKKPNLSSGGFTTADSIEKDRKKLPQDRGFLPGTNGFAVPLGIFGWWTCLNPFE